MLIRHVIIKVFNQQQALEFYTDVVGFSVRHDIEMGAYRWLTMVDQAESIELVLEPAFPSAAAQAQAALYNSQLPALILTSDDIERDVSRLRQLGVRFLGPISEFPGGRTAFFDDSCGNIVNITESI